MIGQFILLCSMATVFADSDVYKGCNGYNCGVGMTQYGPGGVNSVQFSTTGGLEQYLLGGSGPVASGPGGAAASSSAASGLFGSAASSSAAAGGAPGINMGMPVHQGMPAYTGIHRMQMPVNMGMHMPVNMGMQASFPSFNFNNYDDGSMNFGGSGSAAASSSAASGFWGGAASSSAAASGAPGVGVHYNFPNYNFQHFQGVQSVQGMPAYNGVPSFAFPRSAAAGSAASSDDGSAAATAAASTGAMASVSGQNPGFGVFQQFGATSFPVVQQSVYPGGSPNFPFPTFPIPRFPIHPFKPIRKTY